MPNDVAPGVVEELRQSVDTGEKGAENTASVGAQQELEEIRARLDAVMDKWRQIREQIQAESAPYGPSAESGPAEDARETEEQAQPPATQEAPSREEEAQRIIDSLKQKQAA